MTNLGYVTCLHQKDTVWPEYAGPYLKSWVLILLVLVILVVLVRESPLLAGLLLSRQEKSKQLSLYRSMSYLSYIDSHIYCCQLIFWLSLRSLPSIYMLKFSQSPEEDNCIFYQCDIRTWARKCSTVSSADNKFTCRQQVYLRRKINEKWVVG